MELEGGLDGKEGDVRLKRYIIPILDATNGSAVQMEELGVQVFFCGRSLFSIDASHFWKNFSI